MDEDAPIVMARIQKSYQLKEYTWTDPKRYLGGAIQRFKLPNGIKTWSLLSDDYLKEVTKMVKDMCTKDDGCLKMKQKNSFRRNYCPEMDVSDKLGDKLAALYQ